MNLNCVKIPDRYNYIGCFLTLNCNLNCDYCINWHDKNNISKQPLLDKEDWVKGLNRLASREDLPVTLQGGEPSLYPDFIWLINNLKPDLNIDILTNLTFNVDNFIKKVEPARLDRKAPYPNIRASYHPGYMSLKELIGKVLKIKEAGFSIGIYGILHPKFSQKVLEAQKICLNLDIDFRTKEFLGEFNGKLYGLYSYPESINKMNRRKCLCRTSELIIGPNGSIFKCHRDMYANFSPVGNLMDSNFEIKNVFRECGYFGNCNPCDVKIKTNRFQIYGHTSVEIKDIKDGIN